MKPAVLVVEDNRDNTTLLAWALEEADYDYRTVETAEEGLELLEQQLFDIVLMDISLPGMDGKEATERLRNDPRFANLPIIAVTAHAIAEEEEAIMACGVNEIMTKPVDVTSLLKAIAGYLHKDEASVEQVSSSGG